MAIPLGWECENTPGFGFHAPASNDLIAYDGDAPVCVIAPTGAGKGRDFLVPLLLSCDGPMIVLDLKGELSAITRRTREAMGQGVHVLDPFGVTGKPSGRLNPLDLFALEGTLLEPDAEMLASMLGEGHESGKEPFWPDAAGSLISGVIAYIASGQERRMRTLRDMILGGDTDLTIAKLLDAEGDKMPAFALAAMVGYLEHAAQNTRPSVLSTARTFLSALNSDRVTASLEDSTFSLADVVRGTPLTVFITVPPEKLKSHRSLLRLWVATLLTAVMRRRTQPEKRTIFALDEAGQLGTFEPLLTAATLLRGYGMQLVTLWQDLAQMKGKYPLEWQTVLNNTAALLTFGHGHYAACKEYAEVVGVSPAELMQLGGDHAMLSIRGEGTRRVRRLNYLRDQAFAGKADPNPYYGRGL